MKDYQRKRYDRMKKQYRKRMIGTLIMSTVIFSYGIYGYVILSRDNSNDAWVPLALCAFSVFFAIVHTCWVYFRYLKERH